MCVQVSLAYRVLNTGVTPIGPGLHFISKNEKNKKSKFAIKNEGVSTQGSLKVVEHRSQKASVRSITFKIFSAGQNIVSNNGRMHHLDSLLSKFSLHVKMMYQIAAECTIYRPCYHICSSGSIIKCQNVHQSCAPSLFSHFQGSPCFRDIVFKLFSFDLFLLWSLHNFKK